MSSPHDQRGKSPEFQTEELHASDSISNGSIPLRTMNTTHSTNATISDVADQDADQPPFKEGGIQGWTVVAGSTTMFFVVLGLVYSFGVLQSELLHRGYASSSTLGWVSSTTTCLMPLLSIPITALIRCTSNRFVGLLGALCTGFGYIATSYTFDKSVSTLFCAQTLLVSNFLASLP